MAARFGVEFLRAPLQQIQDRVQQAARTAESGQAAGSVAPLIEALEHEFMAAGLEFDGFEVHVEHPRRVRGPEGNRVRAALRHKARFLGTHFWNPPHIVPLVEVVRGERQHQPVQRSPRVIPICNPNKYIACSTGLFSTIPVPVKCGILIMAISDNGIAIAGEPDDALIREASCYLPVAVGLGIRDMVD